VSLRIRLSRVGAKKQPSYRIVVADSSAPRDGRFIAILGHYNPLTDPYTLKVDEERTVSWLKKGAQPSETARGLLNKAGIVSAFEAVRKDQAQKPRFTAEEAKARREARATRTEPPRLVRPVRKDGEAPVAAATTTRKPAAKATARARSTAKSGTAKSGASKSGASKSGAAKSGAAKSGAAMRRRTTAKKPE